MITITSILLCIDIMIFNIFRFFRYIGKCIKNTKDRIKKYFITRKIKKQIKYEKKVLGV